MHLDDTFAAPAHRPRSGWMAWPPVLAAVLAVAALLGLAGNAHAQDETPLECTLGLYLISLNRLDPGNDHFGAEFWLWFSCPGSDRNPLDTLELANADEVSLSNASSSETPDGSYTYAKVSGIFRADWDLRDFPFDEHTLPIRLEEADLDLSAFSFVPDRENSGMAADASGSGWRITSFALEPGVTTYETNFGDPRIPSGSSASYSRVELDLGIERAEISSFFQLTAVVYAAFVLAMLAYFLSIDLPASLDPQFAILAAALFGIAINLLATSSALGQQNGLTLIDEIHLAALGCLGVTAVVAILSRLAFERDVDRMRIFRWNMVALALTVLGFVLINVFLVMRVARGA